MATHSFRVTDQTAANLCQELADYEPLADSVRALAEASLMTTVDAATADRVRRRIDELTEELRSSAVEGHFGVTFTRDGAARTFGNAVVGRRNPVAVPLDVQWQEDRSVRASFRLGPVYEGPDGLVHGGVSALVLDQVLGEAAAAAGAPGMTGTLRLRYRRPLRLGPCSVRGWVESVEGTKTIARGELRDQRDRVCVEAEGVFILPRWARESSAADGSESSPAARPTRFE